MNNTEKTDAEKNFEDFAQKFVDYVLLKISPEKFFDILYKASMTGDQSTVKALLRAYMESQNKFFDMYINDSEFKTKVNKFIASSIWHDVHSTVQPIAKF